MPSPEAVLTASRGAQMLRQVAASRQDCPRLGHLLLAEAFMMLARVRSFAYRPHVAAEPGRDLNEDPDLEKGQGLVSLGAESLSAVAGASIGLAFGPLGLIVGAAAGPSMTRILRLVGGDIRRRLFSSKEEERIGGALFIALARITQRQAAGEQPRTDGLFEPGQDPEGLLEGALLTAARSYQQMKVPFVGAFYASFLFADDISADTGQYLLRLLDRLTYRQLAALAFIGAPRRRAEREQIRVDARESGDRTSPTLLAELTDLANLGLVGFEQSEGRVANPLATMGRGQISAGALDHTVLTGLGRQMVNLAELYNIPTEDQDGIASAFQGLVA
jgi:hypothetical protein